STFRVEGPGVGSNTPEENMTEAPSEVAGGGEAGARDGVAGSEPADLPPLPTAYRNPLVERYASAEMSRIFSPAFKFGTWRRLWLALAEAEHELGLPIPAEALAQMRERLDVIDLKRAAELERRFRHD